MYFSIFAHILTKDIPKGCFFFSFFALILTKALPKGCLSLCCPYSTKTLLKRVCFFLSIPAFILIKFLPEWVFFFLFFLCYPDQSPAAKCFSIYFCPYRVFHAICALSLTKALPQTVFFSIFAVILTKPSPKRVFSLFCPFSKQSPTKKGVSLYFPLILTKALPIRVFSQFLP